MAGTTYLPPLEEGDDLYPQTREEHSELLSWANAAFDAAKSAKADYETRWKRYYRMRRSYVKRDKKDWRSKVYVPIPFWVIETVAPRLIAALPGFQANPRGMEDVEPAKQMTKILGYASEQSDLELELVKATKQALTYGTGILKDYPDHRTARERVTTIELQPRMETVSQPLPDPDDPMGFLKDLDTGEPVMEDVEVEVGQDEVEVSDVKEYVTYDGPCAEAVDIFNFWVAPEADDIDSARYVIQRTYMDWPEVKKLIKDGAYQLPEDEMLEGDQTFSTSEEPAPERISDIGLGGGANQDSTRKPVEILEFWTKDKRVITVMNRQQVIGVRRIPFDHGQKPYCRIVDHLNEFEFWGSGELEAIEGLVDLENVLVNSRIDNLKLTLYAMFAVNKHHLDDPRELQMGPGRVIGVKGDMSPSDVIERIDLGDVTPRAFDEAGETERWIEKAVGISGYQTGTDASGLNETATGIAQIIEQGANRFAAKTKLFEMMGLKRLGYHFGSMIQQFMSEEIVMRVLGPEGQFEFDTITPEALQGRFDYTIDPQSMVQTETIKREQAMSLFQTLFQALPPAGVDPMTGTPILGSGQALLIKDILEAFGKKDSDKYLVPSPPVAPPVPQPGLVDDGMAPPGAEGGPNVMSALMAPPAQPPY